MNKEFIRRVAKIQSELKAPKGQFNKFGKYNYRSCEDIMEGVKPLLDGLVLTVNDELQQAADRIYIKATATLTDGENSISNSALARESLTKKGMDDSQITGTASSYARKYALNGLFCIDDTKDADSMDNSNHTSASNEPDSNDRGWIDAVKANPDVINQIEDPVYKMKIELFIKEGK
tara:strand:- start:65 stop:595 length:531 start_codon:yes stop_codon:yes gene_type:complete